VPNSYSGTMENMGAKPLVPLQSPKEEGMKALKARAVRIYNAGNDATGGALGIVRTAVMNFGQARGAEAAASIAYYAFFSLFPLLLVLITIGSFLVRDQGIVQVIINWSTEVIPVTPEIIERNIETVLEQRGTVGLVALIGLLWSGTNVFAILALNINRSFPGTEHRNLLQHRVSGLIMVAVLMLFVSLSFLLRAILSLFPVIVIPFIGEINLRASPIWTVVTGFVPFFMMFFVFLALYRLIPRTNVRWSQVFWGALTAASGWEIATSGFSWFLGSGLAQYELVYGSLGTVVAFMFYIYLSSWILLFGAHLSAAIKQFDERIRGNMETVYVGMDNPPGEPNKNGGN
jgi:membrane protein